MYLFQKPHARDHILVVGFTKLSADKFLQPVFDLATGADEQLVYHGCASLPLLSAGKRAIPKTHHGLNPVSSAVWHLLLLPTP